MPRLLVVSAALLLGCVGNARHPSTVVGECQTSCDCDPKKPAPVRCPGLWACNAEHRCEYSCGQNDCLEDGGCSNAGEVCNGLVCAPPRNCP